MEAKDLLPLAEPIIQSLITEFIVPIVKKKISAKNNISELQNFEDMFKEYLNRSFVDLSVLNTIAFRNSQKLINDIYVPLTLKCSDHDGSDAVKNTYLNTFPTEILLEYHNILITDTAGMGKSTLLKKMFLDVLDCNLGFPIFIELRKLDKNNDLLSEICNKLNSLNFKIDNDILRNLLVEGKFLIFLDGVDEISLDSKECVIEDIQDFIVKANKNFFIMTSRPELTLTSFGNFKTFEILPLKPEEAYTLLRKYDKNGSISDGLIKDISKPKNRFINEFIKNPLLASLLFTAYEYKPKLPFKKILFYRQVYDALFENHDLSKGGSYNRDKYSKLDSDNFHKILRYIGYYSVIKQKYYFSKDELIQVLEKAKEYFKIIGFVSSDFIRDLTETVPLFRQDGVNYSWAHKSLSEYFAANFLDSITDGSLERKLIKLYENIDFSKYRNLFDLFYDINYIAFRNIIEKRILCEYFEMKEKLRLDFSEAISADDLLERAQYLNKSILLVININKLGKSHFTLLNHLDVKKYCKKLFPDHKIMAYGSNSAIKGKVIVSLGTNFYEILDLLSNKNNPLVKVPIISGRLKKLRSLMESNKLLLKNEILVNNDVKNIFNNSLYFKVMTQLYILSAFKPILISDGIAQEVYDEINVRKDYFDEDLF